MENVIVNVKLHPVQIKNGYFLTNYGDYTISNPGWATGDEIIVSSAIGEKIKVRITSLEKFELWDKVGFERLAIKELDKMSDYKITYLSYLEKIKNETIHEFTAKCIDRIPSPFWTEFASSSGKYHGGDDLRIEHVIGCLRLADEVIRQRAELGDWLGDEPDQMISAIMLHDGWTCLETSPKYTQEDVDNGKCLPDRIGRFISEKNHADLAFDVCHEIGKALCPEDFLSGPLPEIAAAIYFHAGPWTPGIDVSTKKWFAELPNSSVIYQTHNVDYMQTKSAMINRGA